MELMHLKEFVVVSELLNFSKAAHQLYTTQSVLSKHIAKIESELDVKLFERDSHRVALTNEGEIFLDYAKLITSKYDEAILQIEQASSNRGRVIRVGYLTATFGLMMPNVKRCVESRCSHLEVRPRSYEIEELPRALSAGKIDVMFTHDIDASERAICSSMKICTEQLYIIVHQDNPLAKRNSISADDLLDLPLLLPDPIEMPTLSGFFASVIPYYASLEKNSTYCDVDTLVLNIRADRGVGLSCGKHPTFEHTTVYLPITGIDTSFDICAMWLANNDADHIRHFIDALEETRDEWFA